jgi:Zn-dependent protease
MDARPGFAVHARRGWLLMTDPFPWSLPLGRWAGTKVRAHLLLILFVIFSLFEAAISKKGSVPETAGWLALLLLALAVHELAHALAAARVEFDQDEVRIWPLGNLSGPSLTLASRSGDALFVAATGLAASLVLALGCAIGLYAAGAWMALNPFAGGAPHLLKGGTTPPFTSLWWIGWFGYCNYVILLANLIPVLPMDAGRIVRCLFDGSSRDNLIPAMCGRVSMIVLGAVGLIRILFAQPGGLYLIGLALLVFWMTRLEAHLFDEGEFLDDGVFGYDFSQGYTSLEAGAATVRPRREGALLRWRRRRSELRRRRREAREAAEEQRMDEILVKLHREGRSALTDEEQRFLVRVSAKYKNRSRARD